MKIGVIADDFTGASDIALTLAEAGMSVVQFVGVPDEPADPALGAGVIGLKSRTAPVAEAVAHSMAACEWLLAQGASQIILKVCSTFDSTADGNIGPVLDALAARLSAGPVLVCPAFPENGRSVYQGHLFVADRLINESGMQDHPLTPMTDPDLRRVLAAQSCRDIGHIPARTVLEGADAIKAAAKEGQHLIVDAITDADLHQIGGAARDLPLLCGGSGIALGLPANHGYAPKTPSWQGIRGPGVVVSGSCSRATRAQVMAFTRHAPALRIEAETVVADGYDPSDLADWALAQDRPGLIYSSADPDVVKAAQENFGAQRTATAIERLFARLAGELALRGVRRIVVAGGETSGSVVQGLGARQLRIGPRATPGVPLVAFEGIALALKSGNFGGPGFFQETLDAMAATK